MSIELIYSLIKLIGLYFCAGYIYIKIINSDKKQFIPITLLCLLLSIITLIIQFLIPAFLSRLLGYIIYAFIFSKITKNSLGISLLLTTISLSITYLIYCISSGIIAAIWATFVPFENNIFLYLLAGIIELLLVFVIFKQKRLKNGLPFLMNVQNNGYLDLLILILSIIIIFAYFLIISYTSNSIKTFYYYLLFFSLLLVPVVSKAFILYQKQKLQLQALKDYENELSETKQKLETAIEEKQKLVKSNHEFYHRQQALNKKLDDLIKLQPISDNTEFAEEFSNIQDRIQKLSNEYSSKTRTIPKLVKTNIEELDDMLSYMQSECEQNNIEFVLKIDCDINHIIENFITKSQLETLLGDLIRNAIIAINHSSTEYRSILVVFGIKDDSYELCIFDSGIPFEINTLLNLGLQPASTHTNEGGTGIGFITTFETINSCNASFIINEITNSNYSKSMEIKFDNKHEYIIISDRKEKINELNQSNRKIILK